MVLVELWVLSSAYRLDRQQLVAVLEAVLRTQEFAIERADLAWQALRAFRATSGDFADCLIVAVARDASCQRTMAFDRAAARNCSMTLVE